MVFPSLVVIYLVYGLAFFTLGLAVALEGQRLSTNLPFARATLPLAAFGLLHGAHEWLEMFIKEAPHHGAETIPIWVEGFRVALLAISFVALIAFGIKLLYPSSGSLKAELYIGGGLFSLWLVTVLLMALVLHPGDAMRLTVRSWWRMADTWSRYSLAIPGALLSSYALWRYASTLTTSQKRFANYLYLASATFFIYGVVGQVFVAETYLYPSRVINAELFERVVGVPVQMLRATIAIVLALTLIPTLNMFEVERQERLAAAQQRARDELAAREALRREMFRHTVATQEEERRRIARELHDEIGQTLTALSLGLQNLSTVVEANPAALPDALHDLHGLTTRAVAELSHLVSDLRPSQLDHLGLTAALRALVKDYSKRFDLKVDLRISGQRRRLDADVELAIFRIAQEALTNVARHAYVDRAEVQLIFGSERVELRVVDQGIGFVQTAQPAGKKHWGLLGMLERATQLNGSFEVLSSPGEGTRISTLFPLDNQAGDRYGETSTHSARR